MECNRIIEPLGKAMQLDTLAMPLFTFIWSWSAGPLSITRLTFNMHALMYTLVARLPFEFSTKQKG